VTVQDVTKALSDTGRPKWRLSFSWTGAYFGHFHHVYCFDVDIDILCRSDEDEGVDESEHSAESEHCGDGDGVCLVRTHTHL
jgi:hypothetical protein